MYQLSQTLQTAIAAGNPQRVLIEFIYHPDGSPYNPVVRFTNEDILITNGLKMTFDFNSETDLTIGLCPSAEIQFSMLNDQSQLAEFEFGTFRAYLGARIDTGTPGAGAKTATFTEGGRSVLYEFAPLGVFIAHRPDIVRKTVIDVDANDQMTLFDEELPSGVIIYPATLYSMAEDLCKHVGVTLKQDSWLNSDIEVSVQPEQFDGATMREVIGWIAEAGCCNARFDRSGLLEFVWFNTVNRTYDEHDYSDFTPTWYATKAIDGLRIRNADETSEFSAGTGTNAYMIQNNPFLKQSGTVPDEEDEEDEDEDDENDEPGS